METVVVLKHQVLVEEDITVVEVQVMVHLLQMEEQAAEAVRLTMDILR